MSRRRQFGTVRKLRSGKWQARYRLADGRLVSAPQTFTSKSEASRWLAQIEIDQARGLWLDPDAGQITLSEYATSWLQTKVRIAPRTREMYALQLRLHILPPIADDVRPLGLAELAQLSPEWVRAWYAALATKRSPSVAAKAYTRLRQIMGQAVNDDRIAKNPCRIASGGAERHPEQRMASLVELYQLADAVPDRYRALVLMAGYTGLRQGELFALRRRDLDLLHATVVVQRKRLRLASGKVIEDAPKSDAGRRKVAMPLPLVIELEHHLAAFAAVGSGEYVFTSSTGEPLDACNFRRRVWLPAADAVGLTRTSR